MKYVIVTPVFSRTMHRTETGTALHTVTFERTEHPIIDAPTEEKAIQKAKYYTPNPILEKA